MATDYKIVVGTVAALAAFEAAVEAEMANGYEPVGNATSDGTGIWQSMVKGSVYEAIDRHPITAVDAGADEFTIAGEHADDFRVGFRFTVEGSTGNDGIWTVETAVNNGGNTEIVVREDVTSAVADGTIVMYAAFASKI